MEYRLRRALQISVVFLFFLIFKCKGVTELKVGVIVISGHDAPYDIERTGAAIDLAFERVNRDLLNSSYTLKKIERKYGPKCDAKTAPGLAADMFYKDNIIALIGPGCAYALDPSARLAGYWNISIITGLGDWGEFKFKINYPTLTRMAYCQCRLRKTFGSVFKKFNWTDIVLMYDREDVHARTVGETLDAGLRKGNYYPYVIKFYGSQVTDPKILLKEASDHARIILLILPGESVREYMIHAHDMGYTNGDYVFMDVELFKFKGDYWGDHSWQRGDADDAKAKKAYESLLRMALYQPDSADYREFSRAVKNRSKILYGFDYQDEEVNFFSGSFYDGVWLFGLALNETLQLGLDPAEGYVMTRRMWNRAFEGITGEVIIDANGDRDTTYAIMDMDPDTGQFEAVAYYGKEKTYVPIPGKSIRWPNGRKSAPPNTPRCWLKNDNPACQEKKPLSPIIIVALVLICISLIGSPVAFLIYRKKRDEAEINNMSWLIKADELKEVKTHGKSTLSLGSRMSMLSKETGVSGDDSTMSKSMSGANKQLFTNVAMFRGSVVAVKKVQAKLDINRPLLMEVREVRGMIHDNVVRFVGAVIDLGEVSVVTEYCPKGSLQDLIGNENISLNWEFRMSLIQDIVKGMSYIHNSSTQFHGRLHSANCVVDGRFVLKITDFGLPSFYLKNVDEDTHAGFMKLLWKAPEVLREKKPPGGISMQKADVYSFGIMLEEITVRGGPFEEASNSMDPQDIVEKVKNSENTPFRPKVSPDACAPELHALMSSCWAEDPRERPDFDAIKHTIRKMNGGKEGNIMDNLIRRMEQYANNLESIVEDRTRELVDEKRKSEQLLHEILPKSIATQLISGENVEPESFDSVTIYFSDIVGFTALSSASSPIQVVRLLNDLYTCFDAILGNFDVYKVETIGDAYMVVSGLPVPNGSRHAIEIARMSLALLEAIDTFKIHHQPNEKLKLRIGIHTGSCVAGVVGLKMPRYCLFGDTVNTASRMESNGLPLKIHVSPFTEPILREAGVFKIELRGEVEMKGKGALKTYWLEGEDLQPGVTDLNK